MARVLIIILSLLLASGLFADKFLPYLKELTIALVVLHTFFSVNFSKILLPKIRSGVPLFSILIILLLLGLFKVYYIEEGSVFNVKFLLSIFLFVFLSAFFEDNKDLIHNSYLYFGVGAAILTMGYYTGLFGDEVYEIRNDRLILLGENPNSLSVRISLGVLFLIAAVIENSLKLSRVIRIALIVPIPFMFGLIVASGSKGSFILCLGSIFIYILFMKNISKRTKNMIKLISLLALIPLLIYLADSSLIERFYSASSITSGRGEIWKAAIDIFSINPFGVGEIGYKVEIERMLGRVIDTHNLFIYLLVTGGFVSLILFIYYLLNLLKLNIHNYKLAKNIMPLIIFFSMIFVMGKTGGVLTYLVMWYFLATINIKFNSII